MKTLISVAVLTVFSATAALANGATPSQKHISNDQIDAYHNYFISIDVDRSGLISRDEIEFAAEKKHAEFDLDGDGYVTHEEFLQSAPSPSMDIAKALFSGADADTDGRITVDEAIDVARKIFWLDTDQDGYLSFSEIMRAAPPSIQRLFEQYYSDGS